jgi:sulfate permease, SulP family
MNVILKILFPFIQWFPIGRKDLTADLLAGLTVAMVLIPQSMAYAELAGLPAYYGLYAGFIPVIVGAMWGSSWHLQTGPVAMTSLITMTTLVALGAIPGSGKFIALAMSLALVAGLVRIFVGAFRLGFLVNFLSRPVIEGFTNAGALIIAFSQISKIFGLPMGRTPNYLGYMGDLSSMFGDIHLTHMPTLILGVASVIIIMALKKWNPAIPSALIVVVLSSVAVYAFGLNDLETPVKIVGVVPSGLPRLINPIPDLKSAALLFEGALIVVFIGSMEAISVSKALAAKSGQRLNLNQELIGQGMANAVGSFTGSYPVSGSFSRSALNFSVGGKTAMSSIFTGTFVMIALLFFTQMLHYLPKAALSAIIICAVIKLFDPRRFVRFWKINKFDGIASILTFCATMLCAPSISHGILIGGGFAIMIYLYRTMKPRVTLLGKSKEGLWHGVDKTDLDIDPDLPVVRFDGRIYFANVSFFEDTILKYAREFSHAPYIIISCGGINDVDASGIEMLSGLIARLKARNRQLVFAELKHQLRETFSRSGLAEEIGHENIFATLNLADATCRKLLEAKSTGMQQSGNQ